MDHSTRTVPIIVASLVAVLLIGTAYVISGPLPFFLPRVGAESSEELLKEYALKDTDSDGLRDWEEALYGTDPRNPMSYADGKTDGQAVAEGLLTPKAPTVPTAASEELPGSDPATNSLTDRFAREFFGRYLATRGENPPTDEEMLAFVDEAIADLSSSENRTPDTYLATDLVASVGGGLANYAAQVEEAFAVNTVETKGSELMLFADAVQKNDTEALRDVERIRDAYDAIGEALMRIPVPTEARAAHLKLANALAHLSEVSGALASFEHDPLLAFIGMGQYQSYAEELTSAFSELDGVFTQGQVVIEEGVPGYLMLRAAESATAATQQ